ncbi:hypothetical protein [Tunturiibacter gelidoferens]|uniref:Uncharacterized protein n=1 Tax=Tunturiibacter gelidiferens TaxID=3069689 RepID=A0A9X0QAD5_9BACT|nr:hypothetical protein [Edaphobacter lichenicola]MBB5326712.1 hypothetical protein [Edaphobacter lichenicola]
MTISKVSVHELIAWDLDDYPYRDAAAGVESVKLSERTKRARARLAERDLYVGTTALLERETKDIQDLLKGAAQREDLRQEYENLDWVLAVIDLRRLLAFQRRLIFSSESEVLVAPEPHDWPQLISMAIGSQRSTEHVLIHDRSKEDQLDIRLHSSNPDLRLRFHPKTSRGELLPLSLYGGSPFFEVAEFRGRWFLRDGYHRAYHLLQAGVDRVPAVVIYARSIEELGATAPWFFNDEHLFSDHPPQVTDFLDNNMILRYERTALHKVIRIHIEESLEPFDATEGK